MDLLEEIMNFRPLSHDQSFTGNSPGTQRCRNFDGPRPAPLMFSDVANAISANCSSIKCTSQLTQQYDNYRLLSLEQHRQ
jgi:hypothetical protein